MNIANALIGATDSFGDSSMGFGGKAGLGLATATLAVATTRISTNYQTYPSAMQTIKRTQQK